MPILKAKVKTNSKRLKKTIAKKRIKFSNKENEYYSGKGKKRKLILVIFS